ncbi:hypothetical protein V1527DRAFT_456785 [Lipomyces starkeyi]
MLTHDHPPMHKSWLRFSSRCLRIPRLKKITMKNHWGFCGFFIGKLVISVRYNPRMQRDFCRSIRSPKNLIKKFKRPYGEALGSSRAIPGRTMRQASNSYYYMRPNNDYAKEN